MPLIEQCYHPKANSNNLIIAAAPKITFLCCLTLSDCGQLTIAKTFKNKEQYNKDKNSIRPKIAKEKREGGK